MNRSTFVIQVHRGGVTTLENLSTRERIRVRELATVGTQIERWLETVETEPDPAPAEGEPVDTG